MDTFTEELVVRKNSSTDTMKFVVSLLAILAVPAILILLGVTVNVYFIIVAVCAAFFALYGAYYLVTGLYVEYEYAVTNSNITIDKIIAKRSRKRIISVDIKRFNTLKKFNDSDFSKKSYRKIFKASITPEGEDVYGAEMHLDKFGGECLLLFSPSEKVMEAMKPHLKNAIKLELFKNSARKNTSNKKTSTPVPESKTSNTATDNAKETKKSDTKNSKPENGETKNSNVQEKPTTKESVGEVSTQKKSNSKKNKKK